MFTSYFTLIQRQQQQQQRRMHDNKAHEAYYQYRAWVMRNGKSEEVPECFKAFCALHGVTRGRVEHIQKCLKVTGISPKDKRGTHNNREHKRSPEFYRKTEEHIKSFKDTQTNTN